MPAPTPIARALVFASLAAMALSAAGEEVLRVPFLPEDQILHKVPPDYPAAALRNRIQGAVRFTASIGKDGRIESLRSVDGHPLLVRAARKAAEQWIYRPTLFHGQPVRVITTIVVAFQLKGPRLATPKPADERSN